MGIFEGDSGILSRGAIGSGYLPFGSSLKGAASSFLRRNHPDPGIGSPTITEALLAMIGDNLSKHQQKISISLFILDSSYAF